jgi:CBS domain-containing protein
MSHQERLHDPSTSSEREELTASEVISKKLYSVHPEDDVRMAPETIRAERARRLPVVDAERRIQGMISLNDVVLRAKPAGTRPTPALSADHVLATLQTICEHPVSARPTERKDALVPAHADRCASHRLGRRGQFCAARRLLGLATSSQLTSISWSTAVARIRYVRRVRRRNLDRRPWNLGWRGRYHRWRCRHFRRRYRWHFRRWSWEARESRLTCDVTVRTNPHARASFLPS